MFAHAIGRAARSLALFLLLIGPATAGSFIVNPVRVTLTAAQPVTAITVRNSGAEPTVVQLETSSWSQLDGQDVLTATREILATPPIFTIPAGGTQIVRVGLRRKPEADREITYRLFLREVPSQKPTGKGLQVALAISIPVFVVPATALSPQLEWSAFRTADNKLALRATNTGNTHVQVTKVEVAPADGGASVAGSSIAQYVLPGNSKTFPLKAASLPSRGALLQITAQTDTVAMQARVPFEDAPAALTRSN